jgi:hypothetical protein
MLVRQPRAEHDYGYLVAGQLIIDLPKDTPHNDPRVAEATQAMFREAVRAIEAGKGFVILIGWKGERPSKEPDPNDPRLTKWARKSLVIPFALKPPTLAERAEAAGLM